MNSVKLQDSKLIHRHLLHFYTQQTIREIKKIIPFIVASKRIKYLGINSDGKEASCNAGALALIPGSGRSPEEGYGHPLQYSCLENSMDRRNWQAIVHGPQRVEHD